MPELTYISLGWGVQSWTMAAMVALGDLPPIDLAIHPDTGHEAADTYAHAEKWTPWLAEHGIQVVTVTPENNEVTREEWGRKSGSPSIQIPAFTLKHSSGAGGQIRRQCTRHWKLTPIRKHLRSLLGPGNPKHGAVECWQGISLDECSRMRDSDIKYITNVYPLVERRMTRLDCVEWLQQHNLDVPHKSRLRLLPLPQQGGMAPAQAAGRPRLGPRGRGRQRNQEKAGYHGRLHPPSETAPGASDPDTRGRGSPTVRARPALRRGSVLRIAEQTEERRMPEKAKFVIELDLDTLEQMAGIFKQMDVEFDTVDNMICLPQDQVREAIFTGADMEEVLTSANAYLEETGDSYQLLEEFWQLTPATRRDVMELLALNSDWDDGKFLNNINPQAWETFRMQHPEAVRPA